MALHFIFPAAKPLRDALLDWLQMLSGLSLAVFIWAHGFLLSSVVFSRSWMDSIAGFLERSGLAVLGGTAVFLLFLGHFILAARKIPFRAEAQETIWAQARMLHHGDTWLWVLQVVTGMAVLLMGSIHMWVVLNDFPVLAAKSVLRVHSGAWVWFYQLLLLAVEAHLYIGLYRIIVKWGLVAPLKRPFVKKVLAALFIFFLLEGLLTIWYLAGADPVTS